MSRLTIHLFFLLQLTYTSLTLAVEPGTISNKNSAIPHAPIKIEISGVEPNQGQLVVTLFTSKEDFLKVPFLSKILSIKDEDQVTVTLPEIPISEYAVSVYYDKNSDSKLNTNWFGIPVEPIGFSNNPSSRFGPPSFEDARFHHKGWDEIDILLSKARR